jgi:hypothetical protein
MVDAVRSHAPGFIFTTALPPAIAAAATAAIVHLKTSGAERAGQRRAVTATKAALREAGLPVMATETHIVPVMVGDPDLCKQASDLLLERHGIYALVSVHELDLPLGSGHAGQMLQLGNLGAPWASAASKSILNIAMETNDSDLDASLHQRPPDTCYGRAGIGSAAP